MRRRLLWGLLAVVSAIHVGVVAWALGSGLTDAASLLWIFVIVPAMVLGGALLMWKRPGNPIGELLMLAGLTIFVIPTIVEVPTLVFFEQSGPQDWMWAPMWLLMTLNAVGLVIVSALLVLLPDGRFRYPRERRLLSLAWIVVIFPTLTLISNEFVVTHTQAFPGVVDIPSPLVIEALEPYGSAFAALGSLGYGVFLGALALQFMRYRKAPARERKQVRWVLYAGVMGIFLGIIPFLLEELGLVPPLEHGMTAALPLIPMILFPVSVVVAVMEPRWIDVDIVIRKSFVYGALSFVILLLYIGVAGAFGLAAGARLQIEVAIFLTVIVAILFQPARRWLQRLADRWVFGERPTKYEAVAELGATIEEASDPTELLPRLVDTIQRALRLKWARVELDDGTSAQIGEAIEENSILSIPIVSDAERLGNIHCGPKREGNLDGEEVQLVHTLAGQVGLAVANARLASRIVNAAEAERRRIERNIHDGAQQELVALVARLGMARAQAESRDISAETLEKLQREAKQILTDLRNLAQGIHPSVLTDGGILEAVEERCSHLPINVSLDASPGLRSERFADEIEGAAYFFVTESLANILKHADASEADVTLHRTNGRLALVVADDGQGFDPADITENGLAGLRDRITALGGSVHITSRPGSGTRVSATLPVE